MSEAGKGKVISEATIKKIIESRKGYSHSEATRAKMSLAAKSNLDNLIQGIADLRPSETLTGILDGNGVVCIVLALILFEHDTTANQARNNGSIADREELDIICESTDTNPVDSDPDPIQCALVSFLRGEPLDRVCTEFTIAAYGRAQSYGTRPDLVRTCHKFLSECETLLPTKGLF